MAKKFNLNKIYTKVYPKEKLIELIKNCYDKDFIIAFLPRTGSNADILIRSKRENIK